jgi:hypothetical protein
MAFSSRPHLLRPNGCYLPSGKSGRAFRKEEGEAQHHIATSQQADNRVRSETARTHKAFRRRVAAITCDITRRSYSANFRWKRALIKPLIPIASAYHAITGVFSPLLRRASNAPSPRLRISGQGRTDHTGETEPECSGRPYGFQKYGK